MKRVEICRAGETYPGDRLFCRLDKGHAGERHVTFTQEGDLLYWVDGPGVRMVALTTPIEEPLRESAEIPDSFIVYCQECYSETPVEHTYDAGPGWVCPSCVMKPAVR